jgi:hypothetical protein
MRELIPGAIPILELGQKPELRWVNPTALFVDGTYQRSLAKRSKALIKKLVLNFAWRKMKPPIVVETEGTLHCVDGQHTAIAAATLGLSEIPVFVVQAETLHDRADSFVAHNRDRLTMTPMDIFKGKIAANDPDALDVVNVCHRAGVEIKIINTQVKVSIGQTMAVSTIQGLVKRQGVIKARMILEALVAGHRAPISAAEIDAVEAVIVMVRPKTTQEEMAQVIEAVGDAGVIKAKVQAATEGRPHKHMLFAQYMNILEKQTGVPRAIAS